MTTNFKVEKERQIAAPANKVWNVLTTPDLIEKWLGTKTISEWEIGKPIEFRFTWDGKEFTDKGNILKFELNKSFSYDYWSNFSGLPDQPQNYSKVTFELAPINEKTKLKLVHENIVNQVMFEHSDQNWEETMDVIKGLSERE